jgi:hypothetical protein
MLPCWQGHACWLPLCRRLERSAERGVKNKELIARVMTSEPCEDGMIPCSTSQHSTMRLAPSKRSRCPKARSAEGRGVAGHAPLRHERVEHGAWFSAPSTFAQRYCAPCGRSDKHGAWYSPAKVHSAGGPIAVRYDAEAGQERTQRGRR